MRLGISARSDAALRGTVLAINSAGREIRKEIRQQTAQQIKPAWEDEIREAVGLNGTPSRAADVIAKPSRIRVSDRELRAVVSSTRRATSGGMIPAIHGRAVEFGSKGRRRKSYTSRRKGTTYQITNRAVDRQLLPHHPKGSTFYGAGAEMVPRAVSMWVQTAVRTIADAWEGKS